MWGDDFDKLKPTCTHTHTQTHTISQLILVIDNNFFSLQCVYVTGHLSGLASAAVRLSENELQ